MGTTLSATRFCAYHNPPVYHRRRRYRPRTIRSDLILVVALPVFCHLPRHRPSRLPFHLIPQPSTFLPRGSSIVLPLPRACLPSKSAQLGASRAFLPLASFFKRQTAELPFIPCLREPRERTRVFSLPCLFISREYVSYCPLPVSADSAGETALLAAD